MHTAASENSCCVAVAPQKPWELLPLPPFQYFTEFFIFLFILVLVASLLLL